MEACGSAIDSPKDTPIYPRDSLHLRARVKVPVAKLGQWKHPVYGEVSFTQEDFDEVKSNYLSNSLGFKPYLTFGHLEEEPNSTDSHRKRGDAEGFIQEGGVLYGLFDTPDYVTEMVRKGEYQYSSGEFIRNLMDKQAGNKLGCAISRVALTNSPFIPFGEVKAQVLSQAVEVGGVQTFTIKLSQDPPSEEAREASLEVSAQTPEPLAEGNGQASESLESPKEEGQAPIPQTTKPIEVQGNPQGVLEKSTPIEEMSKQEERQEEPMTIQANPGNTPEVNPEEPKVEVTPTELKPETPVQPNPQPAPAPQPTPAPAQQAPAPQMINVEDLILQVRSGIQAEFQAERLQAQTLINNLQAEVNQLKGDLTKQKETAQVFSQTIAKAQEEAQQKQLLSQGMPPVIVPKYIALHNAVMSGRSTMKLSMGAEGEKDVTTLALLHDVVSECLSMGGVPVSQMGSTTAQESPGGLLGDLKAIIEKNKQLANNK